MGPFPRNTGSSREHSGAATAAQGPDGQRGERSQSSSAKTLRHTHTGCRQLAKPGLAFARENLGRGKNCDLDSVRLRATMRVAVWAPMPGCTTSRRASRATRSGAPCASPCVILASHLISGRSRCQIRQHWDVRVRPRVSNESADRGWHHGLSRPHHGSSHDGDASGEPFFQSRLGSGCSRRPMRTPPSKKGYKERFPIPNSSFPPHSHFAQTTLANHPFHFEVAHYHSTLARPSSTITRTSPSRAPSLPRPSSTPPISCHVVVNLPSLGSRHRPLVIRQR